jgi:hypothetical protein
MGWLPTDMWRHNANIITPPRERGGKQDAG